MAPPPPSPSYNWVLDSDSDSESSLSSGKGESRQSPPRPPLPSKEKQDLVVPDEPSQKRKKKKGKKKRKTKNIQTTTPTPTKGVRFGEILVREYKRCLGLDVVPLDGGWPLGMSFQVHDEYNLSSVDEFEDKRQDELRQRWIDLQKRLESRRSSTTESMDGTSSPPLLVPTDSSNRVLETRQFDYKKRVNEFTGSTKNPLFGPLTEEERMHLLVLDSDLSGSNESSPTNQKTQLATSPPKSKMKSSSFQQHHQTTRMGRPRSNSGQFYNDTYTSAEVLHVRNELEQIRVQRSIQGSIGCACRKLDVYLPPPDGGGKKAQHRRMSLLKVKEELRKRGRKDCCRPSSTATRAELEQLLQDLVAKEPCCWGEDCYCVKNGLSCQADACSCWYGSHQRKGHNQTVVEDLPSVETIRERCGNKMEAVDFDAIRKYRAQYCQFIDETVEGK